MIDAIATILRRAAVRLAVLLVIVALPISSASAQNQRGVALVIGNGDYAHLPALANPTNDARAVEDLLAGLGFETTLTTDRDARRLARDLDIFVEDAGGADVAVIFYAGHGIEAGGENFLVPVDADLSALDAAAEKLVPISDFIQQLQAVVPVTIVMLDACRDNPFPPGAVLRMDAASEPKPVSSVGLGETRGAASLVAREPEVENLGTVIAFAAEPGRAALDGRPGVNSPYAAAVLRHLEAMAGEEFGTVMRMVAEEVYLKTAGRQRPWINENLRRLLFFGKAPATMKGEEGEILAERRQLLVTIAALPDFERAQVERAAQQGGVPLDAVFAMLAALGQEAPDDPARLEEMLRAQTERLKEIVAERDTLGSDDAEITRLSALADQAIAEGALATAIRLHERAKKRVEELEATVEDAEADIRARRIEFANVYARSAEAHTLAFDHLAAARDYAAAFDHARRWDDKLAWRYKRAQARNLADHGNYRGDNEALRQAVDAGRQALRLADDLGERDGWASIQLNLGYALGTLGERESGTARLQQAAEAYAAALEVHTRERQPVEWAETQVGLGNVLREWGEREHGPERLRQAVQAFRDALDVPDPGETPYLWARTNVNLGIALALLGDRENSTESREEAAAAFRAALDLWTRENYPMEWATTQHNLGNVLQDIGWGENGTERLEESLAAFRHALSERPRERVPLYWAATQLGLGSTLATLGWRETGTARLEEAVAAFRAALGEFTRERDAFGWATAQHNLGSALRLLGERAGSAPVLAQAVEAYGEALRVRTRESAPFAWADTRLQMGLALIELGKRSHDRADLEAARDALVGAIEMFGGAGHAGKERSAQLALTDVETMLAETE